MTIEFRIVLISGDCATRFETAVDSGVELARILHLGLAGLFVEEEALLDFSALPFSRVIQAGRGGARALDPESMRRAMVRKGDRLRAELSRRAEQSNLRWRFEIGRGRTHDVISKAAQSGDIVVLPTSPLESDRRARLEMARALLSQGRAALLAPDQKSRSNGIVMALIEGSGGAGALVMAAKIAARLDVRLTVHAWPEADAKMGAIEQRLAELVENAAAIDLNVRGRGERLDERAFEGQPIHLIVSQLSLSEKLGITDPLSDVRLRGSGLLLLPDDAD